MSDISPSAAPAHLPLASPAEAPPLPPYTPPAPNPLALRLWSLFTIGVAGSMLAVGLWLRPDPSGTSTHTQMGLPPCGFLEKTGFPCPTCGCTTAVTYFSHGHWIDSFLTQPFGFAVGLFALAAIALCSFAALSGRWIGPDSFTLGFHSRKFLFSGIAIFVGGWLYKILIIRMHLHPV